MNLTRQPLFKDAHNFFRFRRGQRYNTHSIQHNRGEIIYKRSMSSEVKIKGTVDASDATRQQEVVGSDLSVLAPIDEDIGLINLRLATKDRVEKAIHNKYGKRFSVEFFGSIHYGVSHSKSDLDLVVIDPRLSQGFKRLHGLGAIYNVKSLGRTLCNAGFTHVNARAAASVPIVKFRDPLSTLDCDINVNDRVGLINSAMIKEYCDAHPFVRPLLRSVKEWAKSLGLNSPSPVRGSPVSFSSYAFALMTISFLQKEGHLPNLQENLPPVTIKPSKNLMWTRKPHQGWDVRYHSAKDWVLPPLPDFNTLLSSWFSYWIDFPYETECISIRHGGTTLRTFPPPPTPKKKKKSKKAPISLNIGPISVIDPFIETKNVTASISNGVFDSFKTECLNRIESLRMSQRGST